MIFICKFDPDQTVHLIEACRPTSLDYVQTLIMGKRLTNGYMVSLIYP